MNDRSIGILGGSFNPPHIAHKIAAEICRDELDLDSVMIIPSGNHPLKEPGSTMHRLAMTKIAFGNDDNFQVNEIEINNRSNQRTYTVDTLASLKEIHGSDLNITLLIGADNLLELNKWKDPHKLFELAEVAVMLRPGFDIESADKEFSSRCMIMEIPLMEISSTMIRNRVGDGSSIRYLVDEGVSKYIYSNRLYT